MAGVIAGQPPHSKGSTPITKTAFTGVGDCIWRTAHEEGMRALYKGMAVPLSCKS